MQGPTVKRTIKIQSASGRRESLPFAQAVISFQPIPPFIFPYSPFKGESGKHLYMGHNYVVQSC